MQLCSKGRGHAESTPRPSEEGVGVHHVLRPLDSVWCSAAGGCHGRAACVRAVVRIAVHATDGPVLVFGRQDGMADGTVAPVHPLRRWRCRPLCGLHSAGTRFRIPVVLCLVEGPRRMQRLPCTPCTPDWPHSFERMTQCAPLCPPCAQVRSGGALWGNRCLMLPFLLPLCLEVRWP